MELDLIDIKRQREAQNKRPRKKKKQKNCQAGADNRISQEERRIRRKKRRRKRMLARLSVLFLMVLIIICLFVVLYRMITVITNSGEITEVFNSEKNTIIKMNHTERPDLIEDYLTQNPYSRPGEPLPEVKNVFVHYTANPGTSAAQNRSYFENLGITKETSASAHFVIGYDGEIIQCIPLDEIGYAVKERNYDSVSIECCYLKDDGEFTEATYQSLIKLSAWLLKEYKLTPEDMMRHYDAGGKKCPLYYVEHEEAWQKFLDDLERYIMNGQA